ncbi:hypothetical protein GCM10027422_49020 [Hymenobacter arcticus]
MGSESSYPLHPPLLTAADFTAAYGQLFILLAERPLDVPRLQALWTAMDAYTVRVPCPTWPLVLVDADGTRRPLATLPQMLLRLSLDGMPEN